MASRANHPAVSELLAEGPFEVVEDFGEQPDLGGIFAVGFLRGGDFLANRVERLGDFQRRDRRGFQHGAFDYDCIDKLGLLRYGARGPNGQ